ncbi:S8 family serine peptidase [Actinophytocola xanthii]|uniref:Peptidase S8/S53 domain-containing protein n=1 Tax=Actinophytocola xanthii TaxID=1912961 RepID=A0A1Q8CKU8_9PSEU|nr:S8 family serine peptidase [Actinophytocola xanthii]OLF14987.1 hypothetical protein BU204_24070 [Actinophytocola xanthii]
MSHRRVRVGLVAAVIAAGVVVPTELVTTAVAASAAGVVGTTATVTLVTGDTVLLGGQGEVRVDAAPGRERVGFLTRTDAEGDTHVIPNDAVRALARGQLDRRLFDVSELARNGYDDAARATLPLIVDFPGTTPRVAGAKVDRELPGISAAAITARKSPALWATVKNANHVWLDGRVRANLDQTVPQIGAPEAWAAGHTGAGTTVAVLDTGVDASHPDLADALAGARNFTDSDSTDDRHGHGTHVASTITGNGAASGGRYRGVAPDAKVLNGKVLNDGGRGQESWIIAGMEWAAASGADVVNMSLGTELASDGTDPMSQALNRLTADTGTLFVVAAGNNAGQIGSPAAADAALTVGAVDRDNVLAPFSSRGPRLNDGAIKPDITGPGVGVVAAKAANGHIGTPAGDGYVALSGTSMAAPHVAGAAAILASQHPDWTADRLKGALVNSAEPGNATVYEQGAGLVDVAAATRSTVSSAPAALSLGLTQWPHEDDQPLARTVTYTNTGDQPLTLNLAADVRGPDGSAAPAGMFTIAPTTLTVPAGGEARATVTADTSVDVVDGAYGGVVTATGGGQTVRTPVGVLREAESYDLTLRVIGQDGAPTDFYEATLLDVNVRAFYSMYNSSGTVTARLPKGEYFLTGAILGITEAGDRSMAHVAEPKIALDRDVELVLDVRATKPVSFQVDDRPNARAGTVDVMSSRETAWGTFESGGVLPAGLGTVRPATTTSEAFTFTADTRMAEWNGTSFDNSPYLYHVRRTERGTIPADLAWSYRTAQFATVRTEHASTVPGSVGERDNFMTIPLPSTLTEYFTPDVPWNFSSFFELSAPGVYPVIWSVDQVAPRTYKLGRTTTERWGYGVVSPATPKQPVDDGWAFARREGDQISAIIPMSTDQDRDRQGFAFTGSTELLRDGVVIGSNASPGSGSFSVGPERAVYTLRAVADRSENLPLSTRISSEWTCTSERTTKHAALPLLTVRYAPKLNGHNAAPAGKRFTIPVYVQRNGGELGEVRRPTVEVSYNDGRTWGPAQLTPKNGEWQAVVDHPAGAGFVSLRSRVSDAAGNAQTQTVIRAYALV